MTVESIRNTLLRLENIEGLPSPEDVEATSAVKTQARNIRLGKLRLPLWCRKSIITAATVSGDRNHLGLRIPITDHELHPIDAIYIFLSWRATDLDNLRTLVKFQISVTSDVIGRVDWEKLDQSMVSEKIVSGLHQYDLLPQNATIGVKIFKTPQYSADGSVHVDANLVGNSVIYYVKTQISLLEPLLSHVMQQGADAVEKLFKGSSV